MFEAKSVAILDTLKKVDSAIESRSKATFSEKSGGGVYNKYADGPKTPFRRYIRR